MRRRTFLSTIALARLAGARELSADVAVIGGGLGGCAAALAALRIGARVVLTEETAWLGGQATSQLVPAFDEHPWIEYAGSTRSYRDLRNRIRAYYLTHYPVTEEARRAPRFNPGGGWVSGFGVEPKVVVAALEAMLAPYVSSGQLTVMLRYRPVAASVDGDRVRAVTVRGLDSGLTHAVSARFFVDATELGDLLPLTKTEYVTGFESQKQTGEPSAPSEAQPANEQSFTHCFAMEYRAGEDHTIDKPAEYGFWREYVPQLKPAWPGKLLSWMMSNPRTLAPRELGFDPVGAGEAGAVNLWPYRRIAAKSNFVPGTYASDITVVNWPQNDYWLGRLIDVSAEEQGRHIARAKQLSLSLLYWMQTEQRWKGLRLRPDIAGTEDGLAMYPYIREARRIQAEFTVVEPHVSTKLRPQGAARFADSVGTGSYRIDLHPSTGGDNYLDVSSQPFEIPLGALIPKRVENLVAGCKNLGVTHITNGCYRLHPVEWNIGEAAGALAGRCARLNLLPRQVRGQAKLLADFQAQLTEQGVELRWPRFSER
ncbi:MAG: FAD-dependent oxidoreductase [Bryobacterales bacterium]|nr:FAD-dependent oxidoreductase [Bryobacterales bacterium]